MKILVTGASGQLGQDLVEAFEKNWEVVPTDQDNLDITNPAQVEAVLTKEKPDWVIHAAAWTDVEACAENPEKALLINGEGTRNVALAAKKIGAKMIYISTNEVFDGKKKVPYVEADKPNPINPYGVSKLAGEKYTQEILGKDSLIVRTAWLYGSGSRINFPSKILDRAKRGALEVVDDEISTPTYAQDLAKWIKELVARNESGVFHLVNNGSASRYDWAEQIVADKRLEVSLKRSRLADYRRLSSPPKYSVLSNKKAKVLKLKMRSWQEASQEYLSTFD